MQNKINKILFEVNKPSRYTGQEIGSLNKDWNSSMVKAAIVFPDLYEIGVSNLGHRILYNIINNSSHNFLADRVYAPELDFREKLIENNIPLYGVETFKAVNEFDILAISLQYELSYPTLLEVLRLGNVPIKCADRSENDPIVTAGGPGVYNPESLTDFIDVFTVGDGEKVTVELLEEIEKSKQASLTREETLKNIQKLDGVYAPRFYKTNNDFIRPYPINGDFPEKINKRISDIDNNNYPVNFPVPYIQCVHDRAVIEIRRGCGRMCRFCQSCFVNLPVRERSPEKILELTRDILKNTGYDEYSLLSLSSSDYKSIENLVNILNQEHSETGASISLPSQRADAFSVKLAKEVQSVRKSTLTFAPEAGSQRLRDTINKNLNEDQISEAVLSAYKSGWTSIKLYFMIGLPTETYDDLDEIINLLQTLKNKSRNMKNELDLSKHLDITCTISTFVPKPFTPFQWCAQDKVEVINEKIKYLKEKIKYVKGVKLNFNDSFLSQLEAVFSRGDRNLNRLIERVYEKGSYFDAWTEHFNKKIWHEAAEELNINFEEYASRVIELDAELPWDMINIGINKDWLKKEYNNALNSQMSIPCDESCTNCGICDNFNKRPVIKSKDLIKDLNVNADKSLQNNKSVYRYRFSIQKAGNLKYISHLDWQRLLYRSVRKAEIKVCFTQGFNPSPKISLGMALPLFVESFNEYVDIELEENMQENALLEKLNLFLPENSKINKISRISKEEKSIDSRVNWAVYSALPLESESVQNIDLNSQIENILSQENIFIQKEKHKGKSKTVDIRPLINSLKVKDKNLNSLEFVLTTGQNRTLRPDKFLKVISPDVKWAITREKLVDSDFKELV